MTDSSDPGDRHDDFAAGWLLAWKAVLSTGAPVPDVDRMDLPPEFGERLRGSAECLRRLHEAWPARSAFATAVADPDTGQDQDGSVRRIGRFEIRRELGRGGFGVVYLARDPVLNRDVAVKVPHGGTGLDPDAGHRLAVEAQAVARLAHPNIVPVHECGTAGGTTYVVSAYCHGISLADWLLTSDNEVSWQDAARIVAALARAVHHAHARGVLHRDLKPANVLLAVPESGAESGAGPLPLTAYVPRVADFGMAKLLVESSAPLTATGVIRGTPAYMAPEQAAGHQRDITTAVDVYALGAVLYELLVRRPPFTGDNPLAILDNVRVEPPTAPRTIRPGLPADVETVCLKCLDKDPARRYPSAEALAYDLDRALVGEPILARRSGRFERMGRAVRRHPAVAGLSALLIFALVGGLVITGRQLQQTRRERDRAEHHLAQLLEVSERTAVTTIDSFELRTDELRPLRQQLLTDLADRFAALAAQLSDDPAERWLRARCHLQLSTLLFNLDRADESRAAAVQAVEAYEVIARDHLQDPGAVLGLTSALTRLAYVEPDEATRRDSAERARAAYAAYLAIPEAARGPAVGTDIGFASFEYDQAVIATARSDRESARRHLVSACDRLRPLIAPGSAARSHTAPVAAQILVFRCQTERFSGRPGDAAEAGREALTLATDDWRARPADHKAWKTLGSAHLEYGLALQAAGEPERALEVWKEGFDRLGEDGARRSAAGVASVVIRQSFVRLMMAHNLGLGYSLRGSTAESERWYRAGLDLARQLLFVPPTDWQLWYDHGMCCVNLVELGRLRTPPADRLGLFVEGIGSLEKALGMNIDDDKLRSELALCWQRYSTELVGAGQPVFAIACLIRAIAHQNGAVTAVPDSSIYRYRLRLHIARTVGLVTSLGSSTGAPAQLPQAAVIDE